MYASHTCTIARFTYMQVSHACTCHVHAHSTYMYVPHTCMFRIHASKFHMHAHSTYVNVLHTYTFHIHARSTCLQIKTYMQVPHAYKFNVHKNSTYIQISHICKFHKHALSAYMHPSSTYRCERCRSQTREHVILIHLNNVSIPHQGRVLAHVTHMCHV